MSSANTGLSFTAWLAHWSAVHSWIILLATVIVIVLAVFSIIAVGTETRDDDSGVGESGKGSALLNERFAADPSAPSPPGEPDVRASYSATRPWTPMTLGSSRPWNRPCNRSGTCPR